MKKLIAFLVLSACCPTLQGQDPAAVRDQARMYIEQLADPAMHGRGYVMNGDGIAAEWVAQQFKRMGLRPLEKDHFQAFRFSVNSFPDSVKVSVDGLRLAPGVDFIVGPSSGSARGRFNLVHLVPDDLKDPARRDMVMGVVSGNAACLHYPASKGTAAPQSYAELEKELMRFCPVVKKADAKLTWGVSQEVLPFPLIEVAGDALTDSSRVIDIDMHSTYRENHEARNVMGWVKGGSNKWIVVGAHYDHLGRMGPDALFPGANDNASGVAMMLSLAEWFSRNKPKHNMLFVAFAGEEAGLVGSEWFNVDRPIDLSRIELMLNLDIVGTGDEGITVVNATAHQDLFDRLVAINEKHRLLPGVKSRGPACNSDHCSFAKRDIPALFVYTMGGIAAYHDVHDRGETLPLTEFADLYTLLKEFLGGIR